jgi:MFS family permease
MAVGAGTLADIYDPAERGSKIGLYYVGPLLGPAIGPLLGGGLTQGFNWRAIYWFMAIFSGLNFLSFLLLLSKDTFRRERSSAYQAVLRRHNQKRNQRRMDATEKGPTCTHSDNNTLVMDSPPFEEIKLSFTDINPFPPLLLILRRWNNLALLFSSGESYTLFC